jgi:hypothetical protein
MSLLEDKSFLWRSVMKKITEFFVGGKKYLGSNACNGSNACQGSNACPGRFIDPNN